MKFSPAPILALLAMGGGCALAPPSNSGNGGTTASTTLGSAGHGGNGGASHVGGSTNTFPLSGGNTAERDAGATGGTSVTAGTTAAGGATSTGSTPFGGGGSAGGTGSTTTGGSATAGATASGGSLSGGSSARGGTFTGGSITGGSMTGGSGSGGARTGGATASGGSASGGSASGGTSAVGTYSSYPPITNGSSGFTTRFWDCCKPSCGWSANSGGKPVHTCGKDGTSTVGNDIQSACSGGTGYMCYWGAPWSVSDTLSFGFAAHNGVACGTCYQLQFSGTGQYNAKDAGSAAIKGKTMIVQVINTGGIENSQFDLLIPGGGVGANNACTAGSAQWSGADIGAGSGGIMTSCNDDKNCVQQKCQAAFGGKPDLLAGCNWSAGWFSAADNPQILYQKVNCPPELSAKSGE